MNKLKGNNFDIPYICNFSETEALWFDKIVIAIHGFGSSKDSSVIAALANALKDKNIGLLAVDLPAHGESNTKLSVENCLNTIYTAENYLRGFKRPICFYGSSFGAYLTMLYLSNNEEKYGEVMLRVPAVDAYKVFYKNNYTDEEFLRNLKKHDVFKHAHTIKEKLNIIYGTHDNIVDNDDILKLAGYAKCNLLAINGADHRFKKPGELEKIIDFAVKAFVTT